MLLWHQHQLTPIRGIGSLLLLGLSVNCTKDHPTNLSSTLPSDSILVARGEIGSTLEFVSQTRTASFLNNLNNFQQVFGNQNYPRANPEHVSADDNIYTRSSKLTAITDSLQSFTSRSVSSMALQGFGFSIPEDATIQNIVLKVRRFKKGTPSVGDHILSIMRRYSCEGGEPCRYGVYWTYQDSYPGKVYPVAETEFNYLQPGSGNNGGFYHNQTYEWTPAMINHVYFGVRIDNYAPIGKGSVEIYYDLVEVTVVYSVAIQ